MSVRRKRVSIIILEITHSDPSALICSLLEAGIVLRGVESVDDLTINVKIHAKDYRSIVFFLDKNECKYKIIQAPGKYRRLDELLSRLILLIGLSLVFLLTVFIPSRIFFVSVEGNQSISDLYITEYANACGIRFGASRKLVRSEHVKNQLLEAIPQLQWAGITTTGCVAKIQVKEKELASIPAEQDGVGNIVAERDGIIYSCIVEKGSALCKPGQAVQKGQILVSAYTDSGLGVAYTDVQAEIYGLTQRSLTAICPTNWHIRQGKQQHRIKYSIRVGKKVINLYNGSGISDTRCVKIYKENSISLPGNFQLPLSVIRETVIPYDLALSQRGIQEDFSWMSDYMLSYLSEQMIAGQVVHEYVIDGVVDDTYVYTGKFACIEMIGKYKYEE